MFKFNGLFKLEKVSADASRAESSKLKYGAVYYLCCKSFILSARVEKRLLELDKMQQTQTAVISGLRIYCKRSWLTLQTSLISFVPTRPTTGTLKKG